MATRSLSGVLCLLLAPVAALAGCTASAPTMTANRASTPAQPRVATYRCGKGSEIRIENYGSTVRVYGPLDRSGAAHDDPEAAPPAPVELAAAPPGQQNRYGAEGYALVLEGAEALWMKAGKEPLTCLR
jgi:hypothetical protein